MNAAAPPGPLQLSAEAFPLPGAAGPVTLDYLAYDRAHARVWVPVGDTGSVFVFETEACTFAQVGGFATAEREVRGKRRVMGPSAAAVGDEVVYVGNRATGEVCAIDEKALKLGACVKLAVPSDGVAYVASAKEVWVTTPRDHSLAILDAAKPKALKPKLVVKTDGDPEGYAVDGARGIFYTNLEDKNRTLGIEIASHTVKTDWEARCGADGPRGVAVDEARNFVFVACTDGIRVLDGQKGAERGRLECGTGIDNLDYDPNARLLYVAAAKAARLTVVRVDDNGEPAVVAVAATATGARNGVVDPRGRIYIADPQTARLLVFSGQGLRP